MKFRLNVGRCALALLGSFILAFGLYNIHSLSGVTEGGALGLTLLLDYWLGISPAISSAVINIICYAVGIKTFGKEFIAYSLISTLGFSATYKICEFFPPVYPDIANYPLIAALLGAVFVGVGVGLCVRVGGAPTGDDALAMSLSNIFKTKIEWIYLISDLAILLLSLTYIPVTKIIYSLITVTLSSKLVGLVQRMGKFAKNE